jgi:hypothetical protein
MHEVVPKMNFNHFATFLTKNKDGHGTIILADHHNSNARNGSNEFLLFPFDDNCYT